MTDPSSRRTLRLATRGSALALHQARRVAGAIHTRCPDVDVEIVNVTTAADRLADKPLREFGDKGLFVRELEQAMLAGRADAAVHSMKDLPGDLPDGLQLAAVTERENAFDALLVNGKSSLHTLPAGSRLATSSLRRQGQIMWIRSDLRILPVRGNVDTRVRKLHEGEFDAMVLAVAGLSRLNLSGAISHVMTLREMIPAAGQGAIGVEAPIDSAFADVWRRIDQRLARLTVCTERAFIRSIGADCRTPAACHCVLEGARLHIYAMVCSADGVHYLRTEHTSDPGKAQAAAEAAARDLLARGAAEILDTARKA